MKQKRSRQWFIIQKSPTESLWLDGYDGYQWEWTSERKTAWPFSSSSEAKWRLSKVQIQHKEAFVI